MTAAPDYTVDNLVASVFRRTSSPNSSQLMVEDDILAFLDEELRSDILPLIVSVREEYFVNNFDIVMTGAQSYTIPQGTAGGMLRDVVFVDPNGNEVNLQRFQPEHIKQNFTYGYPVPIYTFGYYLVDDQVVLYPPQTRVLTQYILRMKFIRRPNNLTLKINCGQITDITSLAVTLANVDPTWTNADTFDVIQNFPQFNTVDSNQAVSTIVGNVLNFTAVPAAVAEGMWTCPHLMTCVPQIPYEAYPLLVQRGVIRVLESINDSQGTQTAVKQYEKMRSDFIGLVDNRVQGGTKKIKNANQTYWHGFNSPFIR